MATITGLTIREVVAPIAQPIVTSVITISAASLVLVDMHTREGITGRAYLFGFNKALSSLIASNLYQVSGWVAGEQAAPADLYRMMLKRLTLVGHQGLGHILASTIDMLSYDVLAREQELPLAQLLGGTARPMPAYNSNGLGLAPADSALADEAASLVAAGNFLGIKLRLGRDRLRDDVRAVEVVREAIGPDVMLASDFNQGLSVMEAIRRGRALDGLDLAWIEEPIVYDDMPGNAKVTREVATPIQLGENFYGPAMVADAIAAGAGDYLMPDVMRIGGVTGWTQSAALCASANIPMSSHLFPEYSVHLLAVTPGAHWLEYMSWADAILAESLVPENGMIAPLSGYGAGIEWDEEAVARYLVE
jgi:mandelate racemase